MYIIFEDKSYINEEFLSFEEVRDRIEKCEQSYGFCEEKQLYNSICKEVYPRIERETVIKQVDNRGNKTGKNILIIPDKTSWWSFLVDFNEDRFCNLGPKNGAVFNTKSILKYSYHQNNGQRKIFEPRHTIMGRVNEYGNIIEKIKKRISFKWKTPDESICIQLDINDYKEISEETTYREYSNYHLGFVDNNSSLTEFFSPGIFKRQAEWEMFGPDIVLDMSRDGFPMDEQDLMLALTFINQD